MHKWLLISGSFHVKSATIDNEYMEPNEGRVIDDSIILKIPS